MLTLSTYWSTIKKWEKTASPTAHMHYKTQYSMKTQKKRDFICINTRRSSNWLKFGLEPQEALALWALIYESSTGGMVYASQTQLSSAVQCSRPTLSKGINGLVEKGLVSVVGRAQYQISSLIGNKLA